MGMHYVKLCDSKPQSLAVAWKARQATDTEYEDDVGQQTGTCARLLTVGTVGATVVSAVGARGRGGVGDGAAAGVTARTCRGSGWWPRVRVARSCLSPPQSPTHAAGWCGRPGGAWTGSLRTQTHASKHTDTLVGTVRAATLVAHWPPQLAAARKR